MTSAKKSTAAAKSPTASKAGKAAAASAKKATKAAAAKAASPPKSAAKPEASKKAGAKPAAEKASKPPPEKLEEKASPSDVPPSPAPAAGLAKPTAPRLTVRTPAGADELKQKIGALATATANIRTLKRSLQKSFYEIGLILKDVEDRKLYEAKGYGSFESFVEREIDLGKQLGLRLARTVQVFQKEAALQAGLDRVSAAIAVFDGDVDPSVAPSPTAAPSTSGGARSPIPFHKQ